MGIYKRSDSPYWWVNLEGADGRGKRPKQESTKILVSSPEGEKLAMRYYQQRMDDLARVRLLPKGRTLVVGTNSWAYIYFVTDGDLVKIGRTLNVTNRLKGLQTGHPKKLTVLAAAVGAPGLEREIHKRFERDHLRLEWFNPSDEMWAFIEAVKGGMHPSGALANTSGLRPATDFSIPLKTNAFTP